MSMKPLALAVSTFAAALALADVCVEDIKCTQRYPWNGLVDIEYTIACDDPDAEIYVNPVGYNGDTGLTVFPTHFTGDGATNTVKAGKHKMVWDARADMGLFASKNFQIKMYAGKTLAPYVVVDLSSGPDGENFPIRYSLTGPDISDDACRTTELWLRLIPPGTFMMGSPADELGRYDNEDLHKVTITQPFYIGVFEVTYEQYYRVKGSWMRFGNQAQTYPVEWVRYSASWENADYDGGYAGTVRGDAGTYPPLGTTVHGSTFFGILRAKTDFNGFDLPTEAQWEYACRLGTTTALNDGSNLEGITGSKNLNVLGRYYANGTQGEQKLGEGADKSMAKVGSYKPNAYGIYDMHGNVAELCRDIWSEHLGFTACVDPLVSTASYNDVVIRGGAWDVGAGLCRSSTRRKINQNSMSHSVGFRISCPGNLQK